MTQRIFLALAALATAALLAGCGGGGGGDAVVPTAAGSDVPQAALASAQAYTTYVGSVAASNASTPLKLGDIEAPVSDTAEPLTVQ